MARTKAISLIQTGSTKVELSELSGLVISNIQKETLAAGLKSQSYTGNPATGSVEYKRFKNSASQAYGTARTAGKGAAITVPPTTVNLDIHREIVEEAAKFDLDTFGVGNIMARRADNHVDTVAAELDADFFAKAKTAGTKLTAKGTTVEDQLEELIQAVETVKNDYVRGVPRNLIRLVLDPVMYGRARNYLDKGTNNANVDTAAEDFRMFHGVRVYSSINLPVAPGTTATRALCMVDGAMGQPVVMYPYAEPEKIPLSNDYGVSMFYDYGTKALTPDLIFYIEESLAQSGRSVTDMKFRINTTGSIVEPNDETVLEQMKNSPFYTATPDVEPDAQEGDNEGVKPLSKMNKDELLAAAQAAGIDVPDGSTKAEIVELIQAAGV